MQRMVRHDVAEQQSGREQNEENDPHNCPRQRRSLEQQVRHHGTRGEKREDADQRIVRGLDRIGPIGHSGPPGLVSQAAASLAGWSDLPDLETGHALSSASSWQTILTLSRCAIEL